MQRVRQRQLELVFAANLDRRESKEGSPANASGVPVAKAWLRLIAKSKESNSLAAGVTRTSGLLEQIASGPVMAKALLNVAANKGAAGATHRRQARPETDTPDAESEGRHA